MADQTNKQTPKRLKDFKSPLRSCKLFTDANSQLPKFLEQNLIDEARTVKIFKQDDRAHIRIFYFQFLKLCFETDEVDYDSKINKFIQIIESNTVLLKINQKISGKKMRSKEVKDILFQFLEILSQCKEPVQHTLAHYPVINDIITSFLCEYLTKHCKIQTHQYNSKKAIKQLCSLFDVQIVQYDQCLQYSDSQVYSYELDKNNIYLIYIDDAKAVRNATMGSTFSQLNQKGSAKSIEPQNCQVIAFDGPDVVFDVECQQKQDQSKIKIEDEAGTADTFNKTPNVSKNFSLIQNKENFPNQISFYSSCKSKPPTPIKKLEKQISYLDITNQFTNTFILDNIVSQPYRRKIKQLKAKARQQRKARQLFFI